MNQGTHMAVLDAKKRNNLKKSQFAGPGETYPVPDRAHAANAKARAAQQEAAGKLSSVQVQRIDAKANKVLKRK